MDYLKFWKMVSKHDWLPRVVAGELWDLKEHPHLIRNWFSPKGIKERIKYVAIRPWRRLDLKGISRSESSMVKRGDPVIFFAGDPLTFTLPSGGSCGVEKSLVYEFFYHRPKEDKFAGCFTLDGRRENVVVADILKELQGQGMIVDAVVKHSNVTLSGSDALTGGENPVQLFLEVIGGNINQNLNSYEIYLPTK